MTSPHLGPPASRPGIPAPEPPHRAFTSLPGLPARDDPELTALMAAVRALTREGLHETVRSLLRCALAAERTGSPAFMAALAADGLVTFRRRADPGTAAALASPAPSPAGPGASLDVREMLAERGLEGR